MLHERVGPDDVRDVHHDAVGRTTADAIRAYLPEREADFYHRGPKGFMEAAETALDGLGVPPAPERRRSESFAPDPSFAAPAPAPAPQARAL